MLDKQDIALLKGMFKDTTRELRDEIEARILASENRILQGVAEMLDISILPQISDLDQRVTKLEQHTGLA